jgi:hypothetical protein
VNRGGEETPVVLLWSELQRAESLNVVFDDGGLQSVEIADTPEPPDQRPRNATARRDPVSGELRITYDEPEAA